jgi:hypothetical protein
LNISADSSDGNNNGLQSMVGAVVIRIIIQRGDYLWSMPEEEKGKRWKRWIWFNRWRTESGSVCLKWPFHRQRTKCQTSVNIHLPENKISFENFVTQITLIEINYREIYKSIHNSDLSIEKRKSRIDATIATTWKSYVKNHKTQKNQKWQLRMLWLTIGHFASLT